HFSSPTTPLPPLCTLFPYTTLFRSAALEAHTVEELRERLLAADPEAASHVDLANHRRMVRALEIHELTGETPSARASSAEAGMLDRKSTRLNSSHVKISYAVFCLKK